MSLNALMYAVRRNVQEVEALGALKMRTRFTPATRNTWMEEVMTLGQQLLVRIPQYAEGSNDKIVEEAIEAAMLLKYDV